MPKTAEGNDEMRAEYDFSAAPVEGRRGFARSAAWHEQAVHEDEARWLAEAMLRVQQLEQEIVTYFAVARDEEVAAAGDRAIKLLEARGRGLSGLARDLGRSASVPGDLVDRLRRLAGERNWLVHRSFLVAEGGGPRTARIRQLAEDAAGLATELSILLRRRFVDAEMTAAEFERVAEQVRLAWPRAA